MCSEKNKFMAEAIRIASVNASGTGGGPFGAVIVKDGEIVSSASNSVTPDNDPTAHAEVNAIRAACKKLETFDLSGCVLYSSCEPCPMCLSAAYWARLDRVVYAADKDVAAKAGFSDAFIYDELALAPEKRSIVMESIMQKQGNEPFDKWEKNKNKVRY